MQQPVAKPDASNTNTKKSKKNKSEEKAAPQEVAEKVEEKAVPEEVVAP